MHDIVWITTKVATGFLIVTSYYGRALYHSALPLKFDSSVIFSCLYQTALKNYIQLS